MKSDEQILNASIRERRSIRVGLSRLLFVLLPFSLLATVQVIYLVSSMFELKFGDYWIMFTLCSIVSILSNLFVSTLTINAKGEEIYNSRQQDFVGLYSDLKGKKGAKGQAALSPEEMQKFIENEEKRQAIISDINYEATLFGVWLTNLVYIFSFVFMSFIVIRFWPTSWNYYGSTIGAVVLTNYIPWLFVKSATYDE